MGTGGCWWPEFCGSVLGNEINAEENRVETGGEGGQDGVLMTSLEHLDPAIPEAD